MTNLFRNFLIVLFAANSALTADEEILEIDPFSFFSQAIKDTKLLSVNVSLWFKDQKIENEVIWEMEESLESTIQQKFAARGFIADIFQDLSLQPAYKVNPAFYEEQIDLAANVIVDVFKNEDSVFIKLYCHKDYPEFNAPIFERTFHIDPRDPYDEEEDILEWWTIVCHNVLKRIDGFLNDFTKINPGPYGWETL